MKTSILLSIFFFSTNLLAVEYTDEGEIGYETIVSELTRAESRAPRQTYQSRDVFSSSKIHSGVGFTQSVLSFRTLDGQSLQGVQQGIQATLGIDLFSRNWYAEGGIRSFSEAEVKNVLVQLREFDLKIVYRSEPSRLLGYKAGLGLAARDLTISENGVARKFSTPATILLAGAEANISKSFSLGGEISYRTAMVSDSDDRSSFDLALKLDAHF